MKNTIKWFRIIVMVAVIGFSMTGCIVDTTDPYILTGVSIKTSSSGNIYADIQVSGTGVKGGGLKQGTVVDYCSFEWKKDGTVLSNENDWDTYSPAAGSYTVTVTMRETEYSKAGSKTSAPYVVN